LAFSPVQGEFPAAAEAGRAWNDRAMARLPEALERCR